MSERQTFVERNFTLIAISVAIVVFFVLPLVWQFWLAPTVFEQNRESGQEIAEESMESEQAIENYRWFRAQWYDIQSQREQLENYRAQEEQFHETWGDDPQNWTRQAQTRHGRIHDRITGTENQIASMTAEYNARRSDATRAIFTCGLPYRVDEKLYIADGSGVEYTSEEAKKKSPPEDPSECRFNEAPGEASNTTS